MSLVALFDLNSLIWVSRDIKIVSIRVLKQIGRFSFETRFLQTSVTTLGPKDSSVPLLPSAPKQSSNQILNGVIVLVAIGLNMALARLYDVLKVYVLELAAAPHNALARRIV